jgi:hypothetical protein
MYFISAAVILLASLGLGWDFQRAPSSIQMRKWYLQIPQSTEAIDLAEWKTELDRAQRFARQQDSADSSATRPTWYSTSSHRRWNSGIKMGGHKRSKSQNRSSWTSTHYCTRILFKVILRLEAGKSRNSPDSYSAGQDINPDMKEVFIPPTRNTDPAMVK